MASENSMRPLDNVLGIAAGGRSLILVNAQNMLGVWKELNVLNSLIKYFRNSENFLGKFILLRLMETCLNL